MRFTESWRSVKTDGWAISLAGVGNNTDKLHAALALIDYAYSKKGQILMSYGPDEFIAKNEDGSLKMFNFNGQEWPVISDATYAELWERENGNYTNYARHYIGSTLSFAKSQSFEYQCTHIVGKEGAGYISTAIGLGTIKHPELALTENPWWTSVPTVLPTTKTENDMIGGYEKLGSSGVFSSAKGGTNLLINIIISGYKGDGTSSRAETLNSIINDWHGKQYLELKNDAWERLQDYYAEFNK
jgi:putative aldouronate transport system substrate-binding protein